MVTVSRGVYSIDKATGQNLTEVVAPVYARITDLKLFEEIMPLPGEYTPDFI